MQALDTLALHLGPKMVLGPALAFARQGMSSSSRDVRWAACTVALVVVEGCADGLRKRLPEMLQVGPSPRQSGWGLFSGRQQWLRGSSVELVVVSCSMADVVGLAVHARLRACFCNMAGHSSVI